MDIITFEAIGQKIFFSPSKCSFFLSAPSEEAFGPMSDAPSIKNAINGFHPHSYSFCLNVSESCNLNCDYCFNDKKNGKTMSLESAEGLLEKMFSIFSWLREIFCRHVG